MTARRSRRPPAAMLGMPPPLSIPRVSVLALDPAPTDMGTVTLDHEGMLLDWAHWRVAGTIGERISQIERAVLLAIQELRPGLVAMEHGYGNFHSPELEVVLRTIPRICRDAGAQYREYTPSAWRKRAAGYGGLHKEDCARVLRGLYPDLRAIPAEDLDTMDAAGVGKAAWASVYATPLAQQLHAAGLEVGAQRQTERMVLVRTASYR